MTKQEVSEFFRRKGYSADRFGHFVVKKHGNVYRYKLGPKTIRYEVRSGNGVSWVRLRSGYYGKLRVEGEGMEAKLVGVVA